MIRSGLFIAACAALAAPAFAHHGPGTFELGKTVTFDNATLTKIELLNPHGWIYFDNKEADGRITKHRCEMRSAHTLRRSGWTPDLFKVGSKMKVTASPDRADVGFAVEPAGAGADEAPRFEPAIDRSRSRSGGIRAVHETGQWHRANRMKPLCLR